MDNITRCEYLQKAILTGDRSFVLTATTYGGWFGIDRLLWEMRWDIERLETLKTAKVLFFDKIKEHKRPIPENFKLLSVVVEYHLLGGLRHYAVTGEVDGEVLWWSWRPDFRKFTTYPDFGTPKKEYAILEWVEKFVQGKSFSLVSETKIRSEPHQIFWRYHWESPDFEKPSLP